MDYESKQNFRKPTRKPYAKIVKISHNTIKSSTNPFKDQEAESTPTDALMEEPKMVVYDLTSAQKSFKSVNYMFHSIIDSNILFELLDLVCVKRAEYYIFGIYAYRSLQYRNIYPEFAKKIVNCYRPHYRSFVTRPLTYQSIVTIIRHICKMHNIRLEAKTEYKPVYNTDYYIYYQEEL
jgi:hypothetical protein